MAKLSKFQAVQMGSEYFALTRNAAEAHRPFLAEDFRRRAQIIKEALAIHGWRIRPDGINVERVKP
jgi:hypothetical protein